MRKALSQLDRAATIFQRKQDLQQAKGDTMSFILGFLLGFLFFLAYFIWRMLRSDGWDRSNMANAIRLLIHVALHPEDFGKMWYLDERGYPEKRPFWYVSDDELSEVVDSRPEETENGEEEDGLHRGRGRGSR